MREESTFISMDDLTKNEYVRDVDLAFEEIFKLHHRRVYSVCLRMTRNVTEAEELTQEVFVKVFRKMDSYRGEAAFSTWLHRVTVNEVLMHFRKNRTRREQTTEDGELPVATVETHPSDRTSVLDRIVLNEAIDQLAPGYRKVFILHDVEGLQHDEIARVLRCSEGTSKSQLHKARIRLRELLTRTRKSTPGRGQQASMAPALANE